MGLFGATSAQSLESPMPSDGMAASAGHFSKLAEDIFGEPGVRSKVDQVATIVMRNMRFEPGELEVKVGDTIRFIVMNKSDTDHDFTLGDAATQRTHRREMAEAVQMNGGMHHHHDANAIFVAAGQTGELIWKFSHRGNFEFDCNVPGHYEAGMRGVIRVVAQHGTDGKAAPASRFVSQ